MLLKLFLTFTIIPVVEIYLLIQIGTIFGALTSIVLIIITGFLGAYLARIQGLKTLFRIRESLSEGQMPSRELLDALLIGIAGLVLLTPGFLTDAFGFILLIPNTRNVIKHWLHRQVEVRYTSTRPDKTIIEQ